MSSNNEYNQNQYQFLDNQNDQQHDDSHRHDDTTTNSTTTDYDTTSMNQQQKHQLEEDQLVVASGVVSYHHHQPNEGQQQHQQQEAEQQQKRRRRVVWTPTPTFTPRHDDHYDHITRHQHQHHNHHRHDDHHHHRIPQAAPAPLPPSSAPPPVAAQEAPSVQSIFGSSRKNNNNKILPNHQNKHTDYTAPNLPGGLGDVEAVMILPPPINTTPDGYLPLSRGASTTVTTATADGGDSSGFRYWLFLAASPQEHANYDPCDQHRSYHQQHQQPMPEENGFEETKTGTSTTTTSSCETLSRGSAHDGYYTPPTTTTTTTTIVSDDETTNTSISSFMTNMVIDYSQFKQRLKYFTQRRAKIRKLLRQYNSTITTPTTTNGTSNTSTTTDTTTTSTGGSSTSSSHNIDPFSFFPFTTPGQQQNQQKQKQPIPEEVLLPLLGPNLPLLNNNINSSNSRQAFMNVAASMVATSASSSSVEVAVPAATAVISNQMVSSSSPPQQLQQQHMNQQLSDSNDFTADYHRMTDTCPNDEPNQYPTPPSLYASNHHPPTTNSTSLTESITDIGVAAFSCASVTSVLNRRQNKKRNKKNTPRNVIRRLSNVERNEIIIFLSEELSKVNMFYEDQCQFLWNKLKLWTSMDDIHMTQQQQQPQQQHQLLLKQLKWLGNEIIELLAYCVMNVVTVHQILIRYDAMAKSVPPHGTPPLRDYYCKRYTLLQNQYHHSKNSSSSGSSSSIKSNSMLQSILSHKELDALADAWIQQVTLLLLFDNSNTTATTSGSHYQLYIQYFQSSRAVFKDITESTEKTDSFVLNMNDGTCFTCTDGIVNPTALCVHGPSQFGRIATGWTQMANQWLLHGMLMVEDRLGLESAYYYAPPSSYLAWWTLHHGNSLVPEMKKIVQWRQSKEKNWTHPSGSATSDQSDMQTPSEVELSPVQIYPLTLHLLSAFFYCMNYYIVEPSSTMYVNRLGAYDAMSGTLIGMMPLAAFLSSLPYSMWTNYSFRYPFILSSCLLVLGNLVYGLADHYGQIQLVLLGRFICGLGAPKCIIRRYIADTTPLKLRTTVNAGFGMMVAAGSALGPAMAVMLNRFDCTMNIPWSFYSYSSSYNNGGDDDSIGFVIHLNGMTLPGYFMACLWMTFAIIILVTFDEPDRRGLEEQQQLEKSAAESAARHISGSDSMISDFSSVVPPTPDSATGWNTRTAYPNAGIFKSSSTLSDLGSVHSVDTMDTEQEQTSNQMGCSSCNYRLNRVFPLAQCTNSIRHFCGLITLPVHICLGLLFAKVFTVEALVSATSTLTKNRYHWQVEQVGILGFMNGIIIFPFSILIGRLSLTYQDRVLMKWLVLVGCSGLFLLIDWSDLFATPTSDYNSGQTWLAVSPHRYIVGYFVSYICIQSFEGVIGSALSKVIPTSLASGTINSGLLATWVDTLGRASGDMFISMMGYIDLRQLMNLLFIPAFTIMLTCFIVIERYQDVLSV